MATQPKIIVHCSHNKMLSVKELKQRFNSFNANEHPPEQVAELVEQFKFQGVRHPAILSLRTGKVIAGHGRVLAAEAAGMDDYPVDEQEFKNEAQEYAFLQADNAIQGWSVLNLDKIRTDLPNIELFDVKRLAIRNLETPNFAPGTEDEQGKLDEKKPVTCPSCGETFVAS